MQLSEQFYPGIRESVYQTVLPSGLTVLAMPRSGWSRYYGVLMTRYGSNDSQFVWPGQTEARAVPDGIAHFLEHQLFAKPWGSADERFAAWGANCNAFTSWTRTAYLFSTTDHFTDCLSHLIDFVYDPYFTAEGTAREQGIIEQEIDMFLDEPSWQVHLNLLQGLFHQHPVRRDIAGTAESVGQVSKQLLDVCYQTFYQPSNMVLVVVGDFNVQEVMQQIDHQMAAKRFVAPSKVTRLYPTEPESIHQAETTVRASVRTPLFALGFKDRHVGLSGEALFRQQVLTELLLHAVIGKSSPLYQKLYAEGLIDGGFESSYAGHPDHGYTTLQGESKDPERLRGLICESFDCLQQTGISEESFLLSRRALHGQFLQSLNGLENTANDLADGFFDGIDFLRYPDVLTELTLADLNRRLREHLRPEWTAFSQVLPL